MRRKYCWGLSCMLLNFITFPRFNKKYEVSYWNHMITTASEIYKQCYVQGKMWEVLGAFF